MTARTCIARIEAAAQSKRHATAKPRAKPATSKRHATAVALALAVAGTVLSRKAAAQLPNLVEISSQYMPGVPLRDPRPTEAQVSTYEATLNLPLPLSDTMFLIPGFGYHVDSLSFADSPDQFTPLRAFHSAEMPFLFVKLLPSDWSLSLRIAPGVAGDFEAFDSGLVHVNSLVLVTHEFSRRLIVGGGAMANFSFGSLLPLPAVYLDWTPFHNGRIESFIPAFVNATYTIDKRIEFGARTEVNGNAYAVRDRRVARAWPCAAGANDDLSTPQNERLADRAQCFDHVAYSVATAGLLVGVRVFDNVWLTGFGGRSFFRRFEQMNDDDHRIASGAQDLPNVYFVRAAMAWRIARD